MLKVSKNEGIAIIKFNLPATREPLTQNIQFTYPIPLTKNELVKIAKFLILTQIFREKHEFYADETEKIANAFKAFFRYINEVCEMQ